MQRIVAMIVSVCLLLTGCATLQGVPLPREANERPDVKVGETVEVTTRAGKTERFKVAEVGEEALAGEGVRIAYADMTSLQVNRGDPAHTGLAVYIVGGVLVLGLLIWAIDHLDEAGAAAAYGGSN